MDEPHLLTDLCKICNNQPPKYCCPRCSSRTCSLTCYKRHKIWSQCSGKRDPAAYVKKSQLATPAGIDRDFNFLTGIERAFERADKYADERGIRIYGESKHDAKDGSNLDKYLKSNGIIVDRAPLGMSRQKSNHTRWSAKQKAIIWTLEWVLEDGSKFVRECGAERSISQASETSVPKSKPSGGKTSKSKSKKRKHDTSQGENAQQLPALSQDCATSTAAQIEGLIQHANLQKAEEYTHVNSRPPMITPPDTTPPSAAPPITTATNTTHLTQHFYLAKPHTSHTSIVLITLDPSATITASLRNRTVLEYPTIYVLSHPPSKVPDGYIMEAEYLGQSTKEAEEIEELIKAVPQLQRGGTDWEDGTEKEEMPNDNRPLDERMIAEMLSKDVGVVS